MTTTTTTKTDNGQTARGELKINPQDMNELFLLRNVEKDNPNIYRNLSLSQSRNHFVDDYTFKDLPFYM